MTHTIKMCALNGGALHACLDCRYALDPVGCRFFREYSESGIVYQEIDQVVAERAIKRYLGREE